MAEIVLYVLDGIVELFIEVVYASVSVVEGLVMSLVYIPTIIVGFLALFEQVLMGMFTSVAFIFRSLIYTTSLLMHMPENLGQLFYSIRSGIGFLWTSLLILVNFIMSSITWMCASTFVILKKLVFFLVESTGWLFSLVTYETSNSFVNSVIYIFNDLKTLCSFILDIFISLLLLPMRLIQSFIQYTYNTIYSVMLQFVSTFSYIRMLPQTYLTMIKSYLASYPFTNSISFKISQFKSVAVHSSVDWLARFSQLMLVFAVIIFTAVFFAVIYHMRFKIYAGMVALVNMCKTMLLQDFRPPRGDPYEAPPPIIQDHRRRVEVYEDTDEEEDDGILLQAQNQRQVFNNQTRGRSPEKTDGPNVPSTSAGLSKPSSSVGRGNDLNVLLQQERDRQLCVICQDNEKDTLILPCKHLCVCNMCVEQITNSPVLDTRRCPICRGKICSYLDVFT